MKQAVGPARGLFSVIPKTGSWSGLMEMPAQFWLQARHVVYPDCPEANPLQEMRLRWSSDLPASSTSKQLRASSLMIPSSQAFWRTILFMERHTCCGRHSYIAVSHLHVWLYFQSQAQYEQSLSVPSQADELSVRSEQGLRRRRGCW